MSESKENAEQRAENVVKISQDDVETLSMDHPMADFLKNNRDSLKNMTEEEFTAAYDAQTKSKQPDNNSSSDVLNSVMTSMSPKGKINNLDKSINKNIEEEKYSDNNDNNSTSTAAAATTPGPGGIRESIINVSSQDRLKSIVLKFTTLSEANTEAPSFTINDNGASIGRNSNNEVSVPSDARLASSSHANIININGIFYLIDNGHECAASLRIGMGINSNRNWVIYDTCRFSVGNSIFISNGQDKDGNLLIEVIDGPLKGEIKTINKIDGATIGRSSDNSIAVPDRELSRKHSKILYDHELKSYLIVDVGSTNGTYVQLVGPYGGSYRLHINDHILVGRTGFSINRFDYGISEEIGHRATMEDSCAIVQHMNMSGMSTISTNMTPTSSGTKGSLSSSSANIGFFPQSYFAVYDGHGGDKASAYLSQHLHVNIANSIEEISPALNASLKEEETGGKGAAEQTDKLVSEAIKEAFNSTDDIFVKTNEFAQHGSTATTALLLGNRLYCANTGDSRTMLCRNFSAIPMTTDHKPSREDEANRIRAAGGFVIGNRVMGELAVSRAFGDADFKIGMQSIIDAEGTSEGVAISNDAANGGVDSDGNVIQEQDWEKPLIIAEPEIEITTLKKTDQFLLLACDGLFDVFTYDEVVTFVRDNMEKHGDAQRCCQNLTYEAIRKRNSRDNVSVILIILNKWY
jgi:serine/threonine protein phosphatase PrpC/pSer/pThr/pTyr-binding forkhead associated (FHA) protein